VKTNLGRINTVMNNGEAFPTIGVNSDRVLVRKICILYFNSIAMERFCYCARRLNKNPAVPSAVNILRLENEQDLAVPSAVNILRLENEQDLAVPSAVNILRPEIEQESGCPKCSKYTTPGE
jgi:hypothetical protein